MRGWMGRKVGAETVGLVGTVSDHRSYSFRSGSAQVRYSFCSGFACRVVRERTCAMGRIGRRTAQKSTVAGP